MYRDRTPHLYLAVACLAAIVILCLCHSCFGLTITYEGYIATMAGAGTRTTHIEVGDRFSITYVFGPYETRGDHEVNYCSRCQQYNTTLLDVYGSIHGDKGWSEAYLIEEKPPAVLVVYDGDKPGEYDFLGVEKSRIVGYRGYDSEGNYVQLLAGAEFPFVYFNTDWFSGWSILDVPSGAINEGERFFFSNSGPGRAKLDRVTIVHDELSPGDANGNGVFNQFDLVQVAQAGRYLNGDHVPWSQGDWNADGWFDQHDLVAAQQLGTYQAGIVAAKGVPELPSIWLATVAVLAMMVVCRTSHKR